MYEKLYKYLAHFIQDYHKYASRPKQLIANSVYYANDDYISDIFQQPGAQNHASPFKILLKGTNNLCVRNLKDIYIYI